MLALNLKSKKQFVYELIGALLGLLLLAGITIPRFLQAQSASRIKQIQHSLDLIIEHMKTHPETFVDLMMNEGNYYPDSWQGLVIGVETLARLIPDFKPYDYEKDLTFYCQGGPIKGTKEGMKIRRWNWDSNYITLFVNINGANFPHYEVLELEKKEPFMSFPKPAYLFNPSNGLGSAGVLYAHTFEKHQMKKE